MFKKKLKSNNLFMKKIFNLLTNRKHFQYIFKEKKYKEQTRSVSMDTSES